MDYLKSWFACSSPSHTSSQITFKGVILITRRYRYPVVTRVPFIFYSPFIQDFVAPADNRCVITTKHDLSLCTFILTVQKTCSGPEALVMFSMPFERINTSVVRHELLHGKYH